jgi:uncharacterized protein (TIGR03435 family)
MQTILAAILTISAGYPALAQVAEPRLEFEVASIKLSAPVTGPGMRVRMTGGPGTRDPGRFVTENFTLYNVILAAYRIERYQLPAPDWVRTTRVDITAKVPEGATRGQFPIMLQNLLAARFKLALHREKKEMTVYELTVRGDRPKLKESVGEPDAAPRLDKDGLPIIPLMTRNGRTQLDVTHESMGQLADRLSGQVEGQVSDATGLKGRYDITLNWARDRVRPVAAEEPAGAPGDNSGPNLFAALEQQLGLKLVQKKGLVEVLVIDHMEKTPAEN